MSGHDGVPEPAEYIARNVAYWGGPGREKAAGLARLWVEEAAWGIWSIPESQVRVLPDVEGRDTLELGCGTGYFSAWLLRRGARPVGLDPTPSQLEIAAERQREHDLVYPLVKAGAEAIPFPDDSFDLVVSEYGASIWSDPFRWIPEATRVLRPGGELIFLVNSTLMMLCAPDLENESLEPVLRRDYFGMHAFQWPDDHSVEFHLGHGDWIRLLRSHGFEILDLVELQAPADAQPQSDAYVPLSWARRWPCEEIWKVRLVG